MTELKRYGFDLSGYDTTLPRNDEHFTFGEREDGKYVECADYERLREALEKYGEHVGWCTSRWSSEDAPKQCNCGLDDAISGLTPAAGSIGENDAIVAARKKEETC